MDKKLKNLTTKNTKQECLEAYDEAKKMIEELESLKTNPKAIVEKKEKEKIVKESDLITEKNILNPEIIEEYNTLKKGIEAKKNEILELTGIEAQANTLIALVNASKDKQISLDIEYKLKREEKEKEFNEMKASLKAEIDKLSLDKKEKEADIKKCRERNEEEYKYDFDRKKLKDNADWNDIKAKREKELAEKEAIVTLKEKELEDKQSEIEKMKAEIELFPTKLQEAKINGAEEKEKELSREYGYKKHLYEKESEFKIKSLDEKTARLEAEVEELKAEKNMLQGKLDEAYTKIQTIATDTVKATGGVKILSNEKEK